MILGLSTVLSSQFLPEYLSEDTIAKAKKLDQEADELISESKIEDVIFYFDKLDAAEKEECIRKLQSRLNNVSSIDIIRK